MPKGENEALIRRYLEARPEGDLDTVEEMLAPDLRRPQPPSRPRTRPRGLHAVARGISCHPLQRALHRRGPGSKDKVVTRVIGRTTQGQEEPLGSGLGAGSWSRRPS
jgi:hypothetical protein